MSPVLIGIAGASGSGKSFLAQELRRALSNGEPASLLSLDSYYLPLSHLPLAAREEVNFDHPDSLDWPLFLSHLDALSRGEPVPEPVYRFAEHDRAPETMIVTPARFVLVEGILVLHRDDVRQRLALKVYVEAADEVCFTRRLRRDVKERGRTPESVYRQYAETVRPMAEQHVWPTRRWADLTVSGEQPVTAAETRILAALAGLGRPG